MTNLISRIEAAESGSRELDAQLWRALKIEPDWYYDSDIGGYCYMPETGKTPAGDALYSAKPLPHLTTSLDAAIALVKDVLEHQSPSIRIEISSVKCRAAIGAFTETNWAKSTNAAWHKSPALALLIALLRSIDQKEKG